MITEYFDYSYVFDIIIKSFWLDSILLHFQRKCFRIRDSRVPPWDQRMREQVRKWLVPFVVKNDFTVKDWKIDWIFTSVLSNRYIDNFRCRISSELDIYLRVSIKGTQDGEGSEGRLRYDDLLGYSSDDLYSQSQ